MGEEALRTVGRIQALAELERAEEQARIQRELK